MKFKNTTQHGFTLIELLVAMVLTILLAGGAILVHLAGRQASLDAESLSRIQENVRFGADYMIRDLRNAGFKDEAFLRWDDVEQIRENYAYTTTDGGLAIRYGGRGHCTQTFNQYRLVENEYFVQNNELWCRGRSINPLDPAEPELITSKAFHVDPNTNQEGIRLVTGVNAVQVAFLPSGCTANLKLMDPTIAVPDPDPTTLNLCTGVQITLVLEGMQQVDNSGTVNRSAVLTAAFRNVVLDLVNMQAFRPATTGT